MADREPRRRRKRKDGGRKEDIDMQALSQKYELRDSELEEEEAASFTPSHDSNQPSKIAEAVFIVLFLAVVVLMVSVFVALKDTKHPVDLSFHSADEETLLPFTDPGQDERLNFDLEGEDIKVENLDIDIGETEAETDDQKFEDSLLELSENGEEDVVSEPEDTGNEIETEIDFVDVPPPIHEVNNSESPPEADVPSIEDVDENFENLEQLVDDTTAQHVVEDTIDQQLVEDIPMQEDYYDYLENTEDIPVSTTPLYENADITNDVDYDIRETLDEIDMILDKSPEKALSMYKSILKDYPASPRALYGISRSLDNLAELKRSNRLLEEALETYQDVMNLKDVPDKLFVFAGCRCVARMQFRGFFGKSVKLLHQMAVKFPHNMTMQNQLAVGYLLIGQNTEAATLFRKVLEVSPSNGFAKVHLGFILKTVQSKYEEAIILMSEGIASQEPGVIDGRFFVHLGDALTRLGKQSEARKVYEDGVQKGLFLSLYQRSLYNVVGLTAKPWWEPKDTVYYKYYKILEDNWLAVRDEALSAANLQGFVAESEGLQDKGNWKQLELFARGRMQQNNCIKAPVTCSLIEKMPEASSCKRGQVKFSLMQPQTHVWAHTGPTNCRLRAHLGLVTPEGAAIRVANETRKWKEGKIILFDDSFEHEVWHNGSSARLVLIVDFWHPELTPYQKASLSPI